MSAGAMFVLLMVPNYLFEDLSQHLGNYVAMVVLLFLAWGVGYRTAPYVSYTHKLFVLLAAYQPHEVPQYTQMQRAANGPWKDFAEAFKNWAEFERQFVFPVAPSAATIARDLFATKQIQS